jgi:hypothetical protein
MQSMGSKTRYSFPCGRWLADSEDDKEIVRELPATGPGIKKPLPGLFVSLFVCFVLVFLLIKR